MSIHRRIKIAPLAACGFALLAIWLRPALAQLPPGGALIVNQTAIQGGSNGDCLFISSAKLGSQACASGAGTVTSVSVVTANGVSGSVATATTTPAITLALGAITPTTVNGNTFTAGTGTLTLGSVTLNAGAGGTLGSNAFTSTAYAPIASPTFTGVVTIPNGGVFGTPTSVTLTNATGLPVSTGLTGAGTGVLTALAVNVGSSGAFVTFNGALGTPSSGVATNLTGTAAGLTAGNVTTNANLTGAVTSSGNATLLGSFSSASLLAALTDETGSGSAVFGTTPTLATPVINGLPTGTGVATANTASTLVSRDGSGNFSAGTITSPIHAGGSGAASTLTLESTSGAGTTDSILFKTASQSTRMTILSGGNIGVGTETNPQASVGISGNVTTGFSLFNSSLLSLLAADGSSSTMTIAAFGTGTNPSIIMLGGRGTAAAATASQTDDFLAFYAGKGFASATADSAAASGFFIAAGENHSAGANGTYLGWFNVVNGGTNRTEKMRLAAGLSVGTTTDPGAGKVSALNGFVANSLSGITTVCTIAVGNVLTFTLGILTAKGGVAGCT